MPFIARHVLRLSFLAGSLLFAIGCASIPGAPASPQQQADVASADALYHQGDFQGAANAYLDLAEKNRSLRDAMLLQAAESWRQENAWDRVTPLLEEIHARRLTPDEAQHFTVLRAEAALADDNPRRAIELTLGSAQMYPAWRIRALEARARAEAANGQAFDAARTRIALGSELEGYDRSQNEAQILAVLGNLDATRLNAEGSGLTNDDPLKPWIAQALAKQGGALAMNLPQLDSPVGTLLPGSTREGYQPPHHVALLLPLGGPLAAAANAVRDGFLTLQQTDPEAAAMHVEIIDSGDSVASALAAYQQAVESGADMAVGPLSSAAVDALFQRSELPLPVLALNHPDEGLPPSGSAEFSMPPEAEGAQVAARMRAQGLDSAVVFVADAGWAQRAARAFRAQFESLGGHVPASAILDTERVNYADIIGQALATVDSNSGIFMAVAAEQGRLLVPQLRIAQVTQPLFATSHIYGADDDAGLDRDLDGVEFCDAPWLFNAQAGLPRRADLAGTMATASGPAARLFAFGMDAYALLPYLGWLREHPRSYLAGATGQLTMDSFGRVMRTPIWARFVNGIAQPSSGSLELDPAATP